MTAEIATAFQSENFSVAKVRLTVYVVKIKRFAVLIVLVLFQMLLIVFDDNIPSKHESWLCKSTRLMHMLQ